MNENIEIKELFGDKRSFAIEASLSQGENYVFISFCYWIKGSKFGDDTLLSVLWPILDEMKSIIYNCGYRHLDISNSTKPKLILDDLIRILWGDNEPLTDIVISEAKLKTLQINPVCECFDGYRIFLIEQVGFDLLLAKDVVHGKMVEQKLSKKTFKKLISNFHYWLIDSARLVLNVSS